MAGRISDLIDAVDDTIDALEEGSTPVPAVPTARRATIGAGRVASTPATEPRLMPSGLDACREHIHAVSRQIMQQALNRYIDESVGLGSGSTGGGSSTAVPPAVQPDKFAGSDLKEAFQKAVSEKSDVKALKGTIGLDSTPHSVRGAVMTILQHLVNVKDGALISALVHQALLLDPVRCIASDASLPLGSRRP